MNMKRIALFALLLVVAGAAHAFTFPRTTPYYCYYYDQNGSYIGEGSSTFAISGSPSLQRGIEYYSFNGVSDNRRITFAKPVDLTGGGTRWEFTINPSGPQCKNTDIYSSYINFANCTDGHSRFCWAL